MLAHVGRLAAALARPYPTIALIYHPSFSLLAGSYLHRTTGSHVYLIGLLFISQASRWKGKKQSDVTAISNDLFLKKHTRPNETRDLGILVETPAA